MKNLLLLTFLIFTGCSVTNAPITEYRIAPQVKSIDYSSSLCKDKSLKVAQVFSLSSLRSKKMNYALHDYQEFSFTESEWAISPNKSITKAIVKSVRASDIFSNVTSFKSRSSSDMILETSVEDFMQYFTNRDEKSYVNVVMSMTLIDAKSSKSVATKTFTKRVDVKSMNAYGGVNALNTALETILQEQNVWLESNCK